jgi:hypothetical protein
MNERSERNITHRNYFFNQFFYYDYFLFILTKGTEKNITVLYKVMQNNYEESSKKKRSRINNIYDEILLLADSEFKTKNGVMQFTLENDLFIEKDLCRRIIQLLHTWEDENVINTETNYANAIFMHLQAHGTEKVIEIEDDYDNLNTIGDYVQTHYNLSSKDMVDFETYIQKNVQYSSTVSAGYCSTLHQSGLVSSNTIEHELVSMYMNHYNNNSIYRTNTKATSRGLNILFTIIRYRKRRLFEILNREKVVTPKNSALDDTYFYNDTYNFAMNPETLEREYNTGLGLTFNNKRLKFAPNKGEIDNNLYGVHLFPYINGEPIMDKKPLRLSCGHLPEVLTPQNNTFDFFKSIFSRSHSETTFKKNIIATIQTKLFYNHRLTFADIFLLGWAIGKKLFIFDPSCNAIQDNVDVSKTRKNTYPKAKKGGLQDCHPLFEYNILTHPDNSIKTPLQVQDSNESLPWALRNEKEGGKNRQHKRRKSKKQKKKQKKKKQRTRRVRPSL